MAPEPSELQGGKTIIGQLADLLSGIAMIAGAIIIVILGLLEKASWKFYIFIVILCFFCIPIGTALIKESVKNLKNIK